MKEYAIDRDSNFKHQEFYIFLSNLQNKTVSSDKHVLMLQRQGSEVSMVCVLFRFFLLSFSLSLLTSSGTMTACVNKILSEQTEQLGVECKARVSRALANS